MTVNKNKLLTVEALPLLRAAILEQKNSLAVIKTQTELDSYKKEGSLVQIGVAELDGFELGDIISCDGTNWNVVAAADLYTIDAANDAQNRVKVSLKKHGTSAGEFLIQGSGGVQIGAAAEGAQTPIITINSTEYNGDNSTPTPIDNEAGSPGENVTFSRSDHKHPIDSGFKAPKAAVADKLAEESSISLAIDGRQVSTVKLNGSGQDVTLGIDKVPSSAVEWDANVSSDKITWEENTTLPDQVKVDSKNITWSTVGGALPPELVDTMRQVSSINERNALTKSEVQNGDFVMVKDGDDATIYMVVDDNNLSNEAGYVPFASGTAARTRWDLVEDKPFYVKNEIEAADSTIEITSAEDGENGTKIRGNYQPGDGIAISKNIISVDNTIATKNDLITVNNKINSVEDSLISSINTTRAGLQEDITNTNESVDDLRANVVLKTQVKDEIEPDTLPIRSQDGYFIVKTPDIDTQRSFVYNNIVPSGGYQVEVFGDPIYDGPVASSGETVSVYCIVDNEAEIQTDSYTDNDNLSSFNFDNGIAMVNNVLVISSDYAGKQIKIYTKPENYDSRFNSLPVNIEYLESRLEGFEPEGGDSSATGSVSASEGLMARNSSGKTKVISPGQENSDSMSEEDKWVANVGWVNNRIGQYIANALFLEDASNDSLIVTTGSGTSTYTIPLGTSSGGGSGDGGGGSFDDANTTYTLSLDGNNLKLSGSDGNSSSVPCANIVAAGGESSGSGEENLSNFTISGVASGIISGTSERVRLEKVEIPGDRQILSISPIADYTIKEYNSADQEEPNSNEDRVIGNPDPDNPYLYQNSSTESVWVTFEYSKTLNTDKELAEVVMSVPEALNAQEIVNKVLDDENAVNTLVSALTSNQTFMEKLIETFNAATVDNKISAGSAIEQVNG